jgi:hypothetical protein
MPDVKEYPVIWLQGAGCIRYPASLKHCGLRSMYNFLKPAYAPKILDIT